MNILKIIKNYFNFLKKLKPKYVEFSYFSYKSDSCLYKRNDILQYNTPIEHELKFINRNFSLYLQLPVLDLKNLIFFLYNKINIKKNTHALNNNDFLILVVFILFIIFIFILFFRLTKKKKYNK